MKKNSNIVTEENLQLITSGLGIIDIPVKEKSNLIQSISNIIALYQDYFNKYTLEEKVKAISLLTLIFSTLLDEEINPIVKKYINKALSISNYNILDVIGG